MTTGNASNKQNEKNAKENANKTPVWIVVMHAVETWTLRKKHQTHRTLRHVHVQEDGEESERIHSGGLLVRTREESTLVEVIRKMRKTWA